MPIRDERTGGTGGIEGTREKERGGVDEGREVNESVMMGDRTEGRNGEGRVGGEG